MNLLLKLSIPLTVLTWLCVRYIDRPVSLAVNEVLYKNSQWSRLTSSLPDTLLVMVVIISVTAYIWYCYRKRKLLLDAYTRLLRHVAWSLPVAYIVKIVLKLFCGRVETRIWLGKPELYGFHWLQGGGEFNGFPSGHMLVFATLFAAIGRYYAGYKPFCYSLLGLMAVLLVATNYHFVADVIFGTYAGFLLEGALYKAFPGKER